MARRGRIPRNAENRNANVVNEGNPIGANPPMPNFANEDERRQAMDQLVWTLGAAYQRQVQRDEAQAAAAAIPVLVDYLEMVNKYQPPTYAGQ